MVQLVLCFVILVIFSALYVKHSFYRSMVAERNKKYNCRLEPNDITDNTKNDDGIQRCEQCLSFDLIDSVANVLSMLGPFNRTIFPCVAIVYMIRSFSK